MRTNENPNRIEMCDLNTTIVHNTLYTYNLFIANNEKYYLTREESE